MNRILINPFRYGVAVAVLASSGLVRAQEPQQAPPPPAPQATNQQDPNGGWRRIGDSNPAPAPGPNDPMPPQGPPAAAVPPQLTIKPGTYVTVRLNQPLSSDKNQVGDAFSATLVRPVVVDGVIVAERGQTLGGRVSEAQKAGKVSGVSRLGLQLTDLPVVDGQQVPIQTTLFQPAGTHVPGPRCCCDRANHWRRCRNRRWRRRRRRRGSGRGRRTAGQHGRRAIHPRASDHYVSRIGPDVPNRATGFDFD